MGPAVSRRIPRAPRYSGSHWLENTLRVPGFHRLWPDFPIRSASLVSCRVVVLLPRRCLDNAGLGCSAFARHYLRNHCCFLLLRVLRCFSSPRSPPFAGWQAFYLPGCPIRISRDQGLFAPPPGFSQLITSFFASESPGIHRLPLLTFFTRHFRAGLISLSSLFFSCSFQFPACQRSFLVENNGFEPLTLCVQSRCSSQLS